VIATGLAKLLETEIVTESDWATAMLDKAGVTETVGVMSAVTFTLAVPVALK
jgi:hypothetical protein